jgi:nitroimidazol reductase NimA-like FMN-containing flavoprotein (pyridoxamine 5'-phosphate oxidase superfamily)
MDPEIERRIEGAPLSAHLATSVADRPHVAPVWYVYEADTLSVVTGGRKLANVRRNPRVAVSIERARGPDVDWMVSMRGTARVVEDADREAAVEATLDEKYREESTDGGDGTDDGQALVEITIGSATLQQY